jgi:hypothetical protein
MPLRELAGFEHELAFLPLVVRIPHTDPTEKREFERTVGRRNGFFADAISGSSGGARSV